MRGTSSPAPSARSCARSAASITASSTPRCGCPTAAARLEPELRQALARELKRGKVDCTLQQRAAPGERREPRDRSARRSSACSTRLRELVSGAARARHSVDLIELLRFPGVLREDSADSEALLQRPRRRCSPQTLPELARARVREGERLGALDRAALAALTRRWSRPCARVCRRSRRACASASTNAWPSSALQVDQERIEQEILLLLQRFDVAEELDRLDGHI